MLFNSLDFAIFLPIVFAVFWILKRQGVMTQNAVIVLASYTFYGWWDYRFLALIIFSTVVDYTIGKKLAGTETAKKRKMLLWTSVIVNIGLLGFFKYYNFFVDNFVTAFSWFGQPIQPNTLHIILPVGISFYTFQTLSYTIDVYRQKLTPTKDPLAFGAFVSFFPQLVAGPIERATHLLPQFYRQRKFHYSKAVDGCRQILWGFFKKMVIADNCAVYANEIFNNYQEYSGSTLVLGAVFFAFQIYGDFAGYSDIAIGTARLFGFDLRQNFAFPYFSRNIGEFWRRWHISLSTWFRDYLYIPLGGSRSSTLKVIRNVLIVFLVSGFWHGANWTFIAWGGLHALFFIPLLLSKRNRRYTDTIAEGRWLPSIKETVQLVVTFILTTLAWVFFRAPSIADAMLYFKGLFIKEIFSVPAIRPTDILVLLILFMLIEWRGRTQKYAIETMLLRQYRIVRWSFYMVLVLVIFIYMKTEETPFIYFQF
ncbi:MBOAT family O-acyltransferase [Winogradskyella sp. A3E31]|uniref:MBOAT family O-acyltransferase n=1 Tax=Winogradskyella sp. A3E31 TaxID=3349637 RepID=UPI00398A8F6C